MLIQRAEVEGHGPVDVRVERGRIAGVAERLSPAAGEPTLDAAGGALLPGLWDHHLHLRALAAAQGSVRCGPPHVQAAAGLAAALAAGEPAAGWLRGVGYHESVAGELDRVGLDALRSDVAVRVQHRSGALWLLNSRAVAALGLDQGRDAPGVERDATGRATGRLFDLDAWLAECLPPRPPPDLGWVGRALARRGVTGATDATVSNGPAEILALAAAAESGALPQRLRVMGTPRLPEVGHPRVARGEVKLVLRERELPHFDALEASIGVAHAAGRCVAIHCVTRAEVLLAIAALGAAGARPGDRLEHASVAPPDAVKLLAELPVAVVTQPGFLYERGDRYAVDVDPDDLPWLYRARGWLDAGVPLGGGSDAPFGEPDPWRAMGAAVARTSAGGVSLGPGERLTPEEALALFTTSPEQPGGAPRRVVAGADADLCLLDRPWSAAREALAEVGVRATLVAGEPVEAGPETSAASPSGAAAPPQHGAARLRLSRGR